MPPTHLEHSMRSAAFVALRPLLAISACWIIGAMSSPAAVEESPLQNVSTAGPKPFAKAKLTLEPRDVIAYVGGGDVAGALDSGHLETLLAVKHPGVRFRNFGWEGDTVFAQTRDMGFPEFKTLFQREQVTVIVLQFGRMEALAGQAGLPAFLAAYKKIIQEHTSQTPRVVLVTPPPFEKPRGLGPDLSRRNPDLAAYSEAIRKLAREHRLPIVDLFAELGRRASHQRLTSDGLQLTPAGHAHVASAFVRQLGFVKTAKRGGLPDESGAWSNSGFEQLRQSVLEKNRLWFDYWRPQNWAFLGGDRSNQPSSRDHRDPNIRWFPQEMENFVPLIASKEREIEQLAHHLR